MAEIVNFLEARAARDRQRLRTEGERRALGQWSSRLLLVMHPFMLSGKTIAQSAQAGLAELKDFDKAPYISLGIQEIWTQGGLDRAQAGRNPHVEDRSTEVRRRLQAMFGTSELVPALVQDGASLTVDGLLGYAEDHQHNAGGGQTSRWTRNRVRPVYVALNYLTADQTQIPGLNKSQPGIFTPDEAGEWRSITPPPQSPPPGYVPPAAS